MANIVVKDRSGATAGSLELADAVFGIEPNAQCVRTVYNQYMANQRAGTHATKRRGEVSGGGKKPWKQKGTGRARVGSSRSPLWRHGGTTFGPQPRDYGFRVNKKVRRIAITSLFSSHMKEGTLIVVDSLALGAAKTKDFLATMEKIGAADGRKILIVNDHTDENLLLSARNLPNVKTVNANNINVFDLLVADRVVLTKPAAEMLCTLHTANDEEAE